MLSLKGNFFLFITFFGLFSFAPQTTLATPYLAAYANTSCSHCHVSPTGGGMRNSHAMNLHDMFSLKKTEKQFDNKIREGLGKFFSIGGDLRLQNLSTVEPPTANTFLIPWGSLYVAADPTDHFTVYTDTDVANTTSREAFGLIHSLPQKSWVKFGRMNLPYGLRVADDSSFIRSDLGLTFSNQDLGIELGAEPGPFTFALAVSNGVRGGAADDNSTKAATWFSEWRHKAVRLGGSFQYNNAAATRTIMGGGHTGVHVGKFIFLGEFDFGKVRTNATGLSRDFYAGYGEIDYRLLQGLYLKTIYDGSDDNIAGQGRHHRIGAGFDLFPIPFLEVSLLYRTQMGTGALGRDQILGVLHGFF